jgi:murein DD-endopeptidase MepM/ murein hydrolase activator NlpD
VIVSAGTLFPPRPPGALALSGVTVTARPGGADVYAEPEYADEPIGTLDSGARAPAEALVFGAASWLGVAWPETGGWVAAEQTDFIRSAAYGQVVSAWTESEPVLDYRRGLVRDLMRARGADAAQIARVDTLSGAALRQLEDAVTGQTMLPGVRSFQDQASHLGLPAPFEWLPVQITPPAALGALDLQGFGPTRFAFDNWEVYYPDTRGMAPGVDVLVPEGSPLIAVADGVIVEFDFLPDPADLTVALRPYLPDTVRARDGSRVLSNVIVGYGHLRGDPSAALVRVGDVVRAGQVIGTSGWPAYTRADGSVEVRRNDAHLHLEVHFVTDGTRTFGAQMPVNPLLFWSPRLIAFQARLASHSGQAPYPSSGQPWGRLGFFAIGCFEVGGDPVWQYDPRADAIWPEGVYDLAGLLSYVERFAPYRAGA